MGLYDDFFKWRSKKSFTDDVLTRVEHGYYVDENFNPSLPISGSSGYRACQKYVYVVSSLFADQKCGGEDVIQYSETSDYSKIMKDCKKEAKLEEKLTVFSPKSAVTESPSSKEIEVGLPKLTLQEDEPVEENRDPRLRNRDRNLNERINRSKAQYSSAPCSENTNIPSVNVTNKSLPCEITGRPNSVSPRGTTSSVATTTTTTSITYTLPDTYNKSRSCNNSSSAITFENEEVPQNQMSERHDKRWYQYINRRKVRPRSLSDDTKNYHLLNTVTNKENGSRTVDSNNRRSSRCLSLDAVAPLEVRDEDKDHESKSSRPVPSGRVVLEIGNSSLYNRYLQRRNPPKRDSNFDLRRLSENYWNEISESENEVKPKSERKFFLNDPRLKSSHHSYTEVLHAEDENSNMSISSLESYVNSTPKKDENAVNGNENAVNDSGSLTLEEILSHVSVDQSFLNQIPLPFDIENFPPLPLDPPPATPPPPLPSTPPPPPPPLPPPPPPPSPPPPTPFSPTPPSSLSPLQPPVPQSLPGPSTSTYPFTYGCSPISYYSDDYNTQNQYANYFLSYPTYRCYMPNQYSFESVNRSVRPSLMDMNINSQFYQTSYTEATGSSLNTINHMRSTQRNFDSMQNINLKQQTSSDKLNEVPNFDIHSKSSSLQKDDARSTSKSFNRGLKRKLADAPDNEIRKKRSRSPMDSLASTNSKNTVSNCSTNYVQSQILQVTPDRAQCTVKVKAEELSPNHSKSEIIILSEKICSRNSMGVNRTKTEIFSPTKPLIGIGIKEETSNIEKSRALIMEEALLDDDMVCDFDGTGAVPELPRLVNQFNHDSDESRNQLQLFNRSNTRDNKLSGNFPVRCTSKNREDKKKGASKQINLLTKKKKTNNSYDMNLTIGQVAVNQDIRDLSIGLGSRYFICIDNTVPKIHLFGVELTNNFLIVPVCKPVRVNKMFESLHSIKMFVQIYTVNGRKRKSLQQYSWDSVRNVGYYKYMRRGEKVFIYVSSIRKPTRSICEGSSRTDSTKTSENVRHMLKRANIFNDPANLSAKIKELNGSSGSAITHIDDKEYEILFARESVYVDGVPSRNERLCVGDDIFFNDFRKTEAPYKCYIAAYIWTGRAPTKDERYKHFEMKNSRLAKFEMFKDYMGIVESFLLPHCAIVKVKSDNNEDTLVFLDQSEVFPDVSHNVWIDTILKPGDIVNLFIRKVSSVRYFGVKVRSRNQLLK